MSRTRLFVANWKMHKTREEARAFARDLGGRLGEKAPHVELVIAPPFTALDAARDDRGRWALAAQNVSSERDGAFTGEISAAMISDAGCRYALIGHSERRRIFGEDDALLARKLARAREADLVPIFCVGETEEERSRGLTESVLARQTSALEADPRERPLVIAYEPVWAIGTGRAATPSDAAAARGVLVRLLEGRHEPRILYGGSVTPDNCGELLETSGMDGFLIGGASLSARGFAAIAGLSATAGSP